MSRVVHVAVGVILGKDDTILIAKRPDDAHQGGLWEFPGGKVEPSETVFDALKRELREELAIETLSTEPLIKIRHDYGDKIVLLDVHKVTVFTGEPKGNEGQPIMWVASKHLNQYEFPAANRPIISAINLPNRILITGSFDGVQEFDSRLDNALMHGIRMVQLRVHDHASLTHLVPRALDICRNYSAKLLINTNPANFEKSFLKDQLGLHLNSKNLLTCESRPVAENIPLGASCHNEHEMNHAQNIGVDFICLSPVLTTQSHPGEPEMGWEKFEELVMVAKVPVFALGGMKELHLPVALKNGAQGIAAISEWWK